MKGSHRIIVESYTIPNVNVASILQQPEDYIDSKEYTSWERYFTTLLVTKTQNDPVWAYSKRKLPEVYLSKKLMNAAKKVMKLIEWD